MLILSSSLPHLLVLVAIACPAPACAGENGPAPTSAAASHHASWTYAGATGPEHWGDLDSSFSACSRGTRQSPIDLPKPTGVPPAPALRLLHWDEVPLSVGNNGHAVQVNDTAPSSLLVDGVTYSLAQFHFHVPAEHSLAGRVFDAELHLVHRAPDGRIAVIAILFQSGAENGPLRSLFDAIPLEPGPPRTLPGKTVDVGALLPATPRFLSYEGSLTTPPCTEGVRWLVVLPDPAPLEIAAADLA